MSVRIKIFEENILAGYGQSQTMEEMINDWLETIELTEQITIKVKDFKYFPASNGGLRLICIYEV